MVRDINPISDSNPHASAASKAEDAIHRSYLESATVTWTPNNDPGDNIPHVVQVKPVGTDTPIPAEVPILAHGDVHVPTEGDRVLVGRRDGGVPMVLFTRYTVEDDVPTYEGGVRRIGHATSTAHLRFDVDGQPHLVDADGNEVTIENGVVKVNGGGQGVVTDVSTTTDADGHVTDVTLRRSSDLEVPSG